MKKERLPLLLPVFLLLLSLPGHLRAQKAEGTGPEAQLLQAAANGDNSRLTRLLAQGVAVNAVSAARDGYQDTPLTLAVLNGRTATVALLLSKGADIETRAYAGQTPLLLAARYDLPEVATRLLAKGANPNPTTGDDLTPLMYAALNGDLPLVKLLVSRGANMNVMTSFDETAQRLAKASKRLDVMHWLRKAGEGH